MFTYQIGEKYGINKDILYLEKLENKRGRFLCPVCGQTFDCNRTNIRKRKCCPKCQNNSLLRVHAGDKFTRLTVLEVLDEKDNDNRRLCIVQCSCDKKTVFKISTHRLLSGNTKSCGCLQREWAIEKNKRGTIDITGQKFGLLTAVKDTGIPSSNGHIWLFDCDCGNKNVPIALGNVHRNTRIGTISCGCLNQSKGEYIIEQCLKNLDVRYNKEHIFNDCRNPKTNNVLRFDFYLPDYNICIEFDGRQHFVNSKYNSQYWWGSVDLQAIQERDNLKNQYCKYKGIMLYRIPYTELYKIDNNYIKSLIEGDKNIYLS